MVFNINDILTVLAESERFGGQEDALSGLINAEGELSEEELLLVAAATSVPDYSSFIAQLKRD